MGAIACAPRKIASAFINWADFPAGACLFPSGVFGLLGGFVQPSATIGNEFGPPERNVRGALVLDTHQHATTFAFHVTGFWLWLVQKGAYATDSSFVKMVGAHACSPSVSAKRAASFWSCYGVAALRLEGEQGVCRF